MQYKRCEKETNRNASAWLSADNGSDRHVWERVSHNDKRQCAHRPKTSYRLLTVHNVQCAYKMHSVNPSINPSIACLRICVHALSSTALSGTFDLTAFGTSLALRFRMSWGKVKYRRTEIQNIVEHIAHSQRIKEQYSLHSRCANENAALTAERKANDCQ